jgi:triosephosphate isomerase (TIM)
MNPNRALLIVGNWKMNKTIAESLELVTNIDKALPAPCKVAVVVAPPFIALTKVVECLHNSTIEVAAQDIFWEDEGAYTGATSGSMLKDVGATYVIIGHSERRQYFHETDETVNKKVKAAFKHKLLPIICVGETLTEREAKQVEAVVERQTLKALEGLSQQELEAVIIAYEPVWAIGTGKTASPSQAEEVHAFIRKTLTQKFGTVISDKIKILYGGSVKPDNSKELLSQPNIDGALVGGASLKAMDFIGIIKNSI